ncbi:MAG: hypothetical protein QF479_05045 [Candidatus Poseidoniaceae archaeon]|nr:hypothetical protein [Candidatus Poseidoniaceae archaeon]HJM87785.1 hypothetical protein [Candidatus Thalassarchaeaceae archaeon]
MFDAANNLGTNNYRAQVTRLNLILDEHLHIVQESIIDKHSRDAMKGIKNARSDINQLRDQIGRMHRSIGMLHTIMKERSASETELVDILLTMKTTETLIQRGAFDESSNQLENLVEHLLANSAALNPFIFYQFWMGVDARWNVGEENGKLFVRIENTNDSPLPSFNVKAPTPPNWRASPLAQSIPRLSPGESIDLIFNISPSPMAAIRDIGAPGSLQEQLSIQTGYTLSPHGLVMDSRIENKTNEIMTDVLIMPWVPPGWSSPSWPFIRILEPNKVEYVSLSLEILK